MKTLPDLIAQSVCFIFGHDWTNYSYIGANNYCRRCGERK